MAELADVLEDGGAVTFDVGVELYSALRLRQQLLQLGLPIDQRLPAQFGTIQLQQVECHERYGFVVLP